MHSPVVIFTALTTCIAMHCDMVHARTFTITNNCGSTLNTYVVGNPAPSQSQWSAAPGSTNQVQVSDNFSAGRVWAVPPGGPQVPATLFEMTLNGGGQDFYDVSLVDGFNLPMSVSVGGGCPSRSCPNNLNDGCPDSMRVKDSNGNTVACVNRDRNYFKNGCPEAYSYDHDDSVTRTCPGNQHADYQITFC